MTEQSVLDKIYHFIQKYMVETGQAPHYTDVAKELGVSMDEVLKIVKRLFRKRLQPSSRVV